ncbi:Zn-ribbon domain-containing OB-fold protein [Streptomyces sp. HD]|uniref:Zn-ribbon domain-containing OB-fold protein n=1 Tax=Streptomyces sp. HD TaxID=3020892 RepID=UPI00232AC4A0|nr:OB-fold domain-containing protein [Streptomyces sp. HD]MDC0770788.1 OB-fold domain-containing protein [Streptomyces sp. HD]
MSDNPNLPATDLPLTAGFWEAAKRHVLTAQKCLDCGYLRYPALEICPRCWSTNQAWTEISPNGTLWSYIVYHRALDPSKKDEIPYVVGRVKTDDGPVFTVRLDIAPEDAKVDMRVTATWDDASDEVTLVRFAAE